MTAILFVVTAVDDVCGTGHRTIHVETACATYFVPGGLKGRGPVPRAKRTRRRESVLSRYSRSS